MGAGSRSRSCRPSSRLTGSWQRASRRSWRCCAAPNGSSAVASGRRRSTTPKPSGIAGTARSPGARRRRRRRGRRCSCSTTCTGPGAQTLALLRHLPRARAPAPAADRGDVPGHRRRDHGTAGLAASPTCAGSTARERLRLGGLDADSVERFVAGGGRRIARCRSARRGPRPGRAHRRQRRSTSVRSGEHLVARGAVVAHDGRFVRPLGRRRRRRARQRPRGGRRTARAAVAGRPPGRRPGRHRRHAGGVGSPRVGGGRRRVDGGRGRRRHGRALRRRPPRRSRGRPPGVPVLPRHRAGHRRHGGGAERTGTAPPRRGPRARGGARARPAARAGRVGPPLQSGGAGRPIDRAVQYGRRAASQAFRAGAVRRGVRPADGRARTTARTNGPRRAARRSRARPPTDGFYEQSRTDLPEAFDLAEQAGAVDAAAARRRRVRVGDPLPGTARRCRPSSSSAAPSSSPSTVRWSCERGSGRRSAGPW